MFAVLTNLVHPLHVFFFGIAAGIWTGVIVTGRAPRRSMNPVVFIEWIQGAHAVMKWFMPSLLATTLLTGLASLIGRLVRHEHVAFIVVDLACLITAISVTRIVEVPIVNRVTEWPSAQPPSNWAAERDRWMRFHFVRGAATVAGFAAALASLVTNLVKW
jgi:hypothetical protein